MISIGKKACSHHPDDPCGYADYQEETDIRRLLEIVFDVDGLDREEGDKKYEE